jgi:hypothetical protein
VLRSSEFFGGIAVEGVVDLVNIAGKIRQPDEDQIIYMEMGSRMNILAVGVCFLTVYLLFVICGSLDRSKKG